MDTPKNDLERMIFLIKEFDALNKIDHGMTPLFGELCGDGLFQDINNYNYLLIESLTPLVTDGSDEQLEFMWDVLVSDRTEEERAELLMNPKIS